MKSMKYEAFHLNHYQYLFLGSVYGICTFKSLYFYEQ